MRESRVERVLMTGDTVGGVWTFTLELARALDAHGIEVMLATMGGDASDDQQMEAASIPNLRLRTSRYKLEWMDDPWLDIQESGTWLLGLQQQFAPDLIHLNTYGHGALAWRAPVVLTAHSCVLSWWNAVKPYPIPVQWTRYRHEVEYSLKAADLLTAPSHAMLRTIEENYGSDLPACRVVANGRSAARYRATAKEPFVLTAGRLWDEAKNVAAVARVAASLPWPVYLAGAERHPSGRCSEFPGCRTLGWLSADALADWYCRASIYALPARYEPFGLSAVEAALSGCALVLGDIPSLRELWGDAAVFVPPGDDHRLESALRGLIEDPAGREDLARRSSARARTFTPERMAVDYAQVYAGLVGRRRMSCAS
jgi:glycogen(starch) synthase